MSELISMREYARRRGVSNVAVFKAVKSGRIKLVGGKIDPLTADRDWKKNTDARQQRGAQADPGLVVVMPPETRTETRADPGLDPGVDGVEVGPDGVKAGPTLADYRRMYEQYRAQKERLEFEVKTGRLVDAEEVRRTAFVAARRVRDMLLSVPDRIAPIAAGQDQFEVHRIMSEELRNVCNDLANW